MPEPENSNLILTDEERIERAKNWSAIQPDWIKRRIQVIYDLVTQAGIGMVGIVRSSAGQKVELGIEDVRKIFECAGNMVDDHLKARVASTLLELPPLDEFEEGKRIGGKSFASVVEYVQEWKEKRGKDKNVN